MMLKAGSLFSGIGSPELAFERCGITTLWASEIDPQAASVHARHFPRTYQLGDIRHVGKHNAAPVDIVVGGSPCQDFSQAGARAGLAGARSGLFHEYIRVIDELKPTFAIWENVPGALSSNEGKDLECVIDSFTDIGYVPDINILDAQDFGVPQRRRRVFMVCVRLDALLLKKTSTSVTILNDLIAQQLLNIWGAIPPAWFLAPQDSVSGKSRDENSVLLHKRMRLFAAVKGDIAVKRLHGNSIAPQELFMNALEDLALFLTGSMEKPSHISVQTDTCEFLWKAMETAISGWRNTNWWLSGNVEDLCRLVRSYTTSTWSKMTTDQKIFMCATVMLPMLQYIIHTTLWHTNSWSVESSVSTLLQGLISYARQSSNYLFIEAELRNCWRDYLYAATDLQCAFEGRVRTERAGEILFERQGIGGYSPTRKKAGADIAFALTGSNQRLDASNNETFIGVPAIARPISTVNNKSAFDDGTKQTFVGVTIPAKTGTLRANGSGLQYASTNIPGDYLVPEKAGTLGAAHGQNRGLGQENEGSFLVAQTTRVRRLMPIECERLMGLPDNWTRWGANNEEMSDAARYRFCGNSMVTYVIERIARRMVEVLR